MITSKGFWRGRDVQYASELTPEIRKNAEDTIHKANLLLARAGLILRDATSGWRPPAVNAGVKGAAKKSNHMLGRAVDIADADKQLQQWCLANTKVLEELGLWMEHPQDTPTWTHVQTVPPGSGRRIFNAR